MSDRKIEFDLVSPLRTIGIPPYDEPESRLLCPYCSFDYVHVHRSFTAKGFDNCESGSGLRGDSLVIQCWSECGSAWELWLAFHKGRTFTQIKPIRTCLESMQDVEIPADTPVSSLPWTTESHC